ncbi:chorismate mutase [Nocardia inohanensis]|uniref:chorismate mutase n=1 Tax=Nocardia inohanensis TaxID=209246 RepID=UPI0008362274|nr:chorismate mutase [Nocardia inohanensis]
MSLEEVRGEIDAIDARIVELLGARQQLVFRAATFKRDPDEVRAPDRRARMMVRLRELALQHGVEPELIERVYTTMIDGFIEIEQGRHRALTADGTVTE